MSRFKCIDCSSNDIGRCAIVANADKYLKKSSKNCLDYENKNKKTFMGKPPEHHVVGDKPKVRVFEDKAVKYLFYVN